MSDLSQASTAQAGADEVYVDKKRYFWILSVFWPATPLIGLYLVSVTGSGLGNRLEHLVRDCADFMVSGGSDAGRYVWRGFFQSPRIGRT